jgi:hypothetical protein
VFEAHDGDASLPRPVPPAGDRSDLVGDRFDWAAQHRLAGALADAAPDVDLVAALVGVTVDLPTADGPTLVEAVRGWERIIAWATAQQALAVAALVDRYPGGRALDGAADEIAAALAISRRGGQNLVDLALDLRSHPEVAHTLSSGAITVRKAQTLLRDVDHLDPDAAAQVLDAVLPQAPSLTVPQLRAAMRRAELAADPAAAEKRHGAACRERGVRMIPAPDAMAWISAFLPAVDAMTVLSAVDALAAVGAPEDARTVDQRRADALVDVCRAVLDTGVGPDGRAVPDRQHRRPHLAVTVAADVLCGARDGSAELVGYGLVPGVVARRIAAESEWTTVVTEGRTGVVLQRSKAYRPSPSLVGAVIDRDVTCTFPGCRIPAPRCDIDHVEPFRKDRPAEDQTRLDNLQPLCRHHHRLKTHGQWFPTRDAVTGVTTWRSAMGFAYTRDASLPEPDFPPLDRNPRPRRDAHSDALRAAFPDTGGLPQSSR